jgi:hypothetical protein
MMLKARLLRMSLFAALVLCSAPAFAQDPPKPLSETLSGEAKDDYEKGVALWQTNRDPGKAIVKFLAAYEKSKDPRLLFNVALCARDLSQWTKVLTYAKRYLAEAGDKASAQGKADADVLIRSAAPYVAKLTVTVNEPGATISVDDEPAGTTPLAEPLLVDIGKRRIKITKPGFREHLREINVTGTEGAPIDVKLERDVHEGKVAIHAGPNDTISLDGKVVGTGRWEGVLPSGGHVLKVSAPGMRTHQTEIVVTDNQTRTVEVTLERETKGGVPLWVWIAGGGVLATGAAIGGYFLFKPDDKVGQPFEGSLAPGIVRLPGFRY